VSQEINNEEIYMMFFQHLEQQEEYQLSQADEKEYGND